MNVKLSNFAPFLSWMRRYRRPHFQADLSAGLTVAVVALPQSMAYALIAGLPVQYGLYASIVPTLVACLWGSSAHLITGPTTAVSLVIFSALKNLAPPGSPAFIELAFWLAAFSGLIQIGMGAARMGNLLDFVSRSVLLGFTAGAAVLIAFKQLPGLFGLTVPKGGHLVTTLFHLLGTLHQSHLITLGLGVITMAVILILKKIRPAWPGTLFALVLVGLLVHIFRLDSRGVAVIGAVPRSLPPFHLPSWDALDNLGQLVSGALAIALLGLVEAVSIAKSISDQTRQRLNINREFAGQGLANLSAAIFSGFPVSGSFTRSAVNFRSGARTPLSGVLSALAVAATVLAAAPLAGILPLAGLAGVLVLVAYDMIHWADLKRTIRATRADAAVLVVTFLSTLLLNIEFAIYVGVLLSIGLHLAKTSRPRIYEEIPDFLTGKMKPAGLADSCPQVDIVYIEGSLFFGSAAFVQEDLLRRLRNHPRAVALLIRMHRINTLDASGVHVLGLLLEEVRRRGGDMYLAGVNQRVFEVFRDSGFLRELGETHLRDTTGSAIRQAMRETFFPEDCSACELNIFQECPDLKKGRWETLGKGVKARTCALPARKAAADTGPPSGLKGSAS
ncbi:MAG: SulP family inorganic anion transporter [Deltaproteobacteria bacterium]|nr:SulP family inorganic anion transporter [Deltaproteobacteria bacterium]